MNNYSQSKKDLANYIIEIENLPDVVVLKNGILPEHLEGDQRIILENTRKQYRDIALWLRYYVLTKKEQESSLKPRCVSYQPFAQLIVARLELTEEIFKRITGLKEIFSSAAKYCWKAQEEKCKETFNQIGLLNKPLIRGKIDAIDFYTKRLKKLAEKPFPLTGKLINNQSNKKNSKVKQEFQYTHTICCTKDIYGNKKYFLKLDLQKNYLDNLFIFASFLSQEDFDFRNKILPKFIKTELRCMNTIRKNKNLASIYLKEDGSLLIQKKHKRGKDKQKRKRRSY